jgi:hypothetical protein
MPSSLLRVSEGIDEEGQLYVRREWAARKSKRQVWACRLDHAMLKFVFKG